MSTIIVKKFYQDVVEQLFAQSKIFWDEEAADETSMTDLKQLWETKLLESGIDLNRDNLSAADGEQTAKTSGRGSRSKNQANASAALSAQSALANSQNASLKAAQQQQVQNHQQQFQQQQVLQEQQQQQQLNPQQQQNQQQPQQQPNPRQQHYLQAQTQQQILSSQQILQNAGVNLNHAQVIVSQKPQNFTSGHSFSLLSSSVPLSGPIVHLSSTVPTSSSVISGLQRSQQNPSFVTVGGTSMLLGNRVMQQNLQQQQQQQHHGQLLLNNDQRSGTSTVIQHNPRGEQLSPQHGRQPPAAAVLNHGHDSSSQKIRQQTNMLNYGNSQQFSMNHQNPNNHNTIFQMGNQIFHHGGLGGHQSVIHIVDSSGNQQPMNSVNPVDISANNVVNAAKPGGTLRKPGQPLTVQLDGADDDDDFVDLSDDEANPDSAGPPAKRLKPSKVTSERLEEPDLGSEDDDDNDPTSVVEVVDNVVVCQYEKVSRTRNKWKLHLKSGMCSLNGKEFIFHKAVGDAEF